MRNIESASGLYILISATGTRFPLYSYVIIRARIIQVAIKSYYMDEILPLLVLLIAPRKDFT